MVLQPFFFFSLLLAQNEVNELLNKGKAAPFHHQKKKTFEKFFLGSAIWTWTYLKIFFSLKLISKETLLTHYSYQNLIPVLLTLIDQSRQTLDNVREKKLRLISGYRNVQPPPPQSPQGKRGPKANLDPMPRSFTSASVKKWRLFLLFRRDICISMMSFWVLTGTYLVTLAWQHYWLTQQWKEHLLVLKVDTVGK